MPTVMSLSRSSLGRYCSAQRAANTSSSYAAFAARTAPTAIDAGSYCRRANPWPGNVALFNHSCLDRTVELRYLPDLAIPCGVAAFPLQTLRGGQELRYNYDGGLRTGSYTVDAHGRAQLLAAGVASAQCACQRPAPCPLGRWLRIFH